MERIQKLLEQNENWVNTINREEPGYFSELAKGQSPDFLWIGCSDSRVPAELLTGAKPGQIFVHRNIANLVVNTDVSLLSVLQYAVEVLKVKDVILCGHYGCGGVNAALNTDYLGIVSQWLKEIKDVQRLHREELNAITNEQEKFDKLVELNVQEQVFNLTKSDVIQKAWKESNLPTIHGLVFDISTGKIKEVCHKTPSEEHDPIYAYQNL